MLADLKVCLSVTFSNAPDQPELVYGSAFFPWPEPVTVQAGDEICVRFDARHVGEEYLWRWDSEVRVADSSSQPKARFQQSTFYGAPLMPARLAKGAAALLCSRPVSAGRPPAPTIIGPVRRTRPCDDGTRRRLPGEPGGAAVRPPSPDIASAASGGPSPTR